MPVNRKTSGDTKFPRSLKLPPKGGRGLVCSNESPSSSLGARKKRSQATKRREKGQTEKKEGARRATIV